MITLYCVGIYFRKDIPFQPDTNIGGVDYMLGSTILNIASTHGLRYQVNSIGHLEYLSYTPKVGDTFAHFLGIDGAHPQPTPVKPAVPPAQNPAVPRAFPFYGQPLSQFENPQPIGQQSQILQFTVEPNSLDYAGKKITTGDPSTPQFYFSAFPDKCEIRTRLINIYVSQAPTY